MVWSAYMYWLLLCAREVISCQNLLEEETVPSVALVYKEYFELKLVFPFSRSNRTCGKAFTALLGKKRRPDKYCCSSFLSVIWFPCLKLFWLSCLVSYVSNRITSPRLYAHQIRWLQSSL